MTKKVYNRTVWMSWDKLRYMLNTHQEWVVVGIVEKVGDYAAFYYEILSTPDDVNKNNIDKKKKL
jgi:hypothetical protein